MRELVANIVYALTLGIGLIASAIMVGVREDKRSLHDIIAGTEVVYVDLYGFATPANPSLYECG